MYFLVAVSLLFTVLLTIGIVAASAFALVGRMVDGYCERFGANTRVSLLFWFRVLPLLIAAITVFAFVLPAFFLYEPHEPQETVGIKLAAVIFVAMAGLTFALFRLFGSWWRTRRLRTTWDGSATRTTLEGVSLPVYRLDNAFPVFAVVGVLRPRIYIADPIFETLDADEIAAVIKHELGHTSAHHNLKRLLMQLCSDVLVAPVGHSLDRSWSKAAEEAADEFAAATGGRQTAVDLAAALIKIARIIPDQPAPAMPAVSYAFNGELLAARVRRLLMLADRELPSISSTRWSGLIALMLAVAFIAAFATNHLFLARIHDISETLLAFLQ
jgi:Zn-dependent protease with chaperone function